MMRKSYQVNGQKKKRGGGNAEGVLTRTILFKEIRIQTS